MFGEFIVEQLNSQAQESESGMAEQFFFLLLNSLSWPANGKRKFGEIVLLPSSDAVKALIAGITGQCGTII